MLVFLINSVELFLYLIVIINIVFNIIIYIELEIYENKDIKMFFGLFYIGYKYNEYCRKIFK